MKDFSVRRAGGLARWISYNTSFTSAQARELVEKLADAGLEDEIVALVESAFEAGADECAAQSKGD